MFLLYPGLEGVAPSGHRVNFHIPFKIISGNIIAIMNRELESLIETFRRPIIRACGIFLLISAVVFLFFTLRISAHSREIALSDPVFWGLIVFCLLFDSIVLFLKSIPIYLREYPCLPDELTTGRITRQIAICSMFPLIFYFTGKIPDHSWYWVYIPGFFAIFLLSAKIIALSLFRFLDSVFFIGSGHKNKLEKEDDRKEEAAEDDLFLAPHVLHQQTRVLQKDGMERIEGCFRIFFDPDEDQKTFHLAFCPSYRSIPFFHVEEISRENIGIKISRLLPFGVRLELKRDRNLDKKRMETEFTYLVLENPDNKD